MSLGPVLLATGVPGNQEWIEGGRKKFLFPISDHHALAKQVIYAINEFAGWMDFTEKNITIIKQKAVWGDKMKAVGKEFR